MTDREEPDAFTDVNETVGAEWEAETTPYERVRDVISYVYDPTSAGTVAEQARTSPKTARKHLTVLAEEGFVTTEAGEHGGTLYRRSPESLVLEQATEILSSVSVDELVSRIATMRETVANYRTKYGVESPEALTVEQTNQTLAEANITDEPDVDPGDVREWQTTRRNLAFANAALSISNARRFVDESSGESPGNVPVR